MSSHSLEAEDKGPPGIMLLCRRFFTRLMLTSLDVVSVFTGAIALFAFAARFSWAADLCCQFRVQLLMFLVPATVVYWVGRRGTIAWWLLMCTVANLMPLIPYVVPKPEFATSSDEISTRVMLLNVLQGNRHHDDVINHVQQHQPDIFVALEADIQWTDGLTTIRSSYPHRHLIDDRGTSSVAVYSKVPFKSVDVIHSTRHRLPSLDIELLIDQQPLKIFVTHPYVPLTQETARMRNEQLDEIEYLVNREGSQILLGDFNCVPWSPHLTDLIETARLTPAGYGRGLRPTWYRRSRWYGPLRGTWVFALKLDHVLLSDDLKVVDYQIGPCLGSDHRPVIVDFIRVQDSH